MLTNQHQFEDPQSISLKFTVKNLLRMKKTKEKLCHKKNNRILMKVMSMKTKELNEKVTKVKEGILSKETPNNFGSNS